MFILHKFISYVASYVSPIQTDFLMTFQKSYGGTVIVFPVEKNTTGAEKTGVLRIPSTGITKLGATTVMTAKVPAKQLCWLQCDEGGDASGTAAKTPA